LGSVISFKSKQLIERIQYKYVCLGITPNFLYIPQGFNKSLINIINNENSYQLPNYKANPFVFFQIIFNS